MKTGGESSDLVKQEEPKGLVYPEYDIVPEFPAKCKWCLGLDFGFSGDPTAIVKLASIKMIFMFKRSHTYRSVELGYCECLAQEWAT